MVDETTLRYRPAGRSLLAFHQSRAGFRGIIGPLGSGKTTACCIELWTLACNQEPDEMGVRRTRWAVIRNTYSDLETTTIRSWREIFSNEFGVFTMGHPPEHKMRADLEDGTTVEADVIFLALDRPDDVRKIRGLEVTGFWINELKEISKSIVDMADLRVGRFPARRVAVPTWFGIIADTNAPHDDHWIYRFAEEETPEGWAFFRQPGGVVRVAGKWQVNPEAENLHNLPPGYYERGMAGKADEWIKVNLANEYGAVFDGKPIYPEYHDSLHCPGIIEPVPGLAIDIGIDFGLTPAALFGQRMSNGRKHWIGELVSTDMGTVRFAEVLKAELATTYHGLKVGSVTGDPAGMQRAQTDERTPFDILRANGISAFPANTNDFEIRREAVATPLRRLIDGKPELLISSACRITRKGMMGGYQFRRLQVAGDERYQDKPDKNAFSHPCEAGQYLSVGQGEGRRVIRGENSNFLGKTFAAETDFRVI